MENNTLEWCGHIVSMEGSRCPEWRMAWSVAEIRWWGQPKVKWAREILRVTKQRNLTSDFPINRHLWRLKTGNRWTAEKLIGVLWYDISVNCNWVVTRWQQYLGRIKLFGVPRQWKHFRPLFQAVFLSGGGITPPQTESNTTHPSPKTEITNILFYILNFASIIKFKM